eukprot:COSAG02_NODE_3982_length_5955_cov_1.767589_4_plen_73_part_00
MQQPTRWIFFDIKQTAIYTWVCWVVSCAIRIYRSKPDPSALLLAKDDFVTARDQRHVTACLISRWVATCVVD